MTETTTKNTTAKPTASFDMPRFEIPKFDMAKVEIPAQFREFAEQGADQAKDAYEKAKVAADHVNGIVNDTYATAAKGCTDYNLKVIEIVRANTNAAFECIQQMLEAKSPSEFIELSTSHVRKQFEATTEQSKELAELAQKVTTDMVRPLNSGAVDALSQKPD